MNAIQTRARRIAAACAALACVHGSVLAEQASTTGTPSLESAPAATGRPTMPTPLGKANLDYPDLAKRAGIGGRLTVAVFVDESGRPTKTRIVSREPMFLDSFDDASRRAVMSIRYTPGRDANGKPVAMWVRQPFSYTLQGQTSARCKVDTAAHYPVQARPAGIEAVVGVFVNLDEYGRPSEHGMTIVGREPTNAKLFDEPAKAALMKTRCEPATQGGTNVASIAVLDIVFTPPVDAPPAAPAPD